MANFYVSSVAWTAIPAWSNHTAVLGEYVRQAATPTKGNERVWRCTVAGATGASEPAWTLTQNSVTVDNVARWTQVHGVEAEQLAGNWRAAAANILALKNSITLVADDVIFLSDDHAETHTANPSLNIRGTFISVDRTGPTLPPTSADLSPGASMSLAALPLTVDFNRARLYGVTFKCGSGAAGTQLMIFRSRGTSVIFDTCTIQQLNTGAGTRITLGGNDTFAGRLIFRNPQFRFSNVSQGFDFDGDHVEIFQEGASPPSFIDGAGSLPTQIFANSTNDRSYLYMHDCDLSALNAAMSNGPLYGWDIVRCKLPTGLLAAFAAAANNEASYRQVRRFWDCSDGGAQIANRMAFDGLFLTGQTDDVVYRVGGASDGTNSYSWKLENNSATQPNASMVSEMPVDLNAYIDASKLGNPVTVTLHILSGWNMTDALIWLTLETLQDPASMLGTQETSRAADWLNAGTALATTTETWNTGVPARQNSHAYVQNDVVKVASNPGIVFIKSNAGSNNSAASEPAGMATAVEGGTVNDGGVVWTAARRLKIEITFTPEQTGWVRGRLKHRYLGNVAWFIDPKLVVS